MDTMKAFEQVSFSWGGIPGRTFLEDAMANDTQGGAAGTFGAHMVLTAKTATLAEQVNVLAVAVGIQAWMDKEPMLAMFLAATLLAAVSPVDMHILDDIAGETLSVIKKMSRKLVLDETRVKALVKVGAGADEAIRKLIQFGFLERAENGDLIIQRKILVRISRDRDR